MFMCVCYKLLCQYEIIHNSLKVINEYCVRIEAIMNDKYDTSYIYVYGMVWYGMVWYSMYTIAKIKRRNSKQ